MGCLPVIERNANWTFQPIATTATTVQGTCLPGFTGSPTRQCLTTGEWGAIQNPCSGAGRTRRRYASLAG